MRPTRISALAAGCLVLCLSTVRAEDDISLLTGPKTGTYIAIGRDIAQVGKEAGLNVEVKPSGGSVDNIKRINSKENAAMGIVQSDVLGFLRRSKSESTRVMAAHLRMIMPLYAEEVHVLARNNIHSFKELEGKRVVVGEDGSGHMLTAVNLLSMTGVTPAETIRKSPPEGVLALLDGQADAVFIVGGKPVKLFKNLESLQGEQDARYQQQLHDVHFLPLDDPRMLEEYQPGELTHADYAFVSEPVHTITARAVLMTYDFSTPGKNHYRRCHLGYALTQALVMHMDWLKAHGHAKWREVSPEAELPLWQKDFCAWHQLPPKHFAERHARRTEKKHSRRAAAQSTASAPMPRDLRTSIKDR
ncbi:MAG: TAXI family TRAP transporter solute-binding subunit [Alphaproteobacteria bacterium]|nr:TAXI family TRAP transporter solute-binding subunit [Alphaproteobacteria bacterium]